VTYAGGAALLPQSTPPSITARRESSMDTSSGKSENSENSAGRQARQGDNSAAAGSRETEGHTTMKKSDKPKKGRADRAAHDPGGGSLLIDPRTLSLPNPTDLQ
jgi:hypothetical protein